MKCDICEKEIKEEYWDVVITQDGKTNHNNVCSLYCLQQIVEKYDKVNATKYIQCSKGVKKDG